MNIRDKLYKKDNKTQPKSINIDKIDEYHKKTGISFARLVNGAIKEFFDK